MDSLLYSNVTIQKVKGPEALYHINYPTFAITCPGHGQFALFGNQKSQMCFLRTKICCKSKVVIGHLITAIRNNEDAADLSFSGREVYLILRLNYVAFSILGGVF